ncbi:ATP-binding protein [Acinetobacter chinensis]|uniref:ATP-binding protein n=1 Tax=Acinetobacter chinensis TaxID=2004650 RepID=UPI002934297F|nr:ATP-binding protein [Acinetobacter chinensis]WOE40086.1 ATP-binding protein [Acinetobacter chinensis]
MNTHFQPGSFSETHEICELHRLKKIHAGGFSICQQCASDDLDKSNEKHQHDVNKMVFEKHCSGALMPERHAGSTFSNYETSTQGQANALQQCAGYVERIAKKQTCNFIMVGSTGTGKTHLACAAAKNIIKMGLTTRYITSEEIASRIMQAWDKDAKDKSEESVINVFAQYDLLIIDEYGLHDREKRAELVHKVLYARYDQNKPTMLISNFTLKKLKNDLGDRLWSRFQHDGLTIVECNWKDARIQEVS